MKKSIISIILAAVLVITSFPVKAAGTENIRNTAHRMSETSTPIATGYDTSCDLFGETLNSMMETWLNDTSYDKITINNSSTQTDGSSQIVFDISDKNIEFPTTPVMSQWFTQAIFNYPNLCIVSTVHGLKTTTINRNGRKIIKKCTVTSPVSVNELKNTIIDYKKNLSYMINNIPSSLSNSSAKLLYLHDQIAGMGDYAKDDSNTRVFMPLGILIDGSGVCQSYAIVMNHATLAAGIPSIVVTGNDHVWNAVQVGNNWYYIDVTWGDESKTNNNLIGRINHRHFLVDHSTLSTDDDSTRPHAIDADFYNIFGSITDSILSSYPNAVPKSESNPYGIGKKMSFLNGSWYYCDNSSIYTWDGKSEYGTKTAVSGVVNCCTFENTLYYAKSNGIFQYIDGINDQKLDDINTNNITDMIIIGDTLKYVENNERKTYSLAKYSTATPTPSITPTPSPSIAPTPSPSATATPTTSPTRTKVPAATASSSAAPTETKTPNTTTSPSTAPTGTQTPNTMASPSAKPTGTQTPGATASPSATPTATQTSAATPSVTPTTTHTPGTTASPTITPTATYTPENTDTPSILPTATQIPTASEATTAPSKTSKPITTKRPQISDDYEEDFDDEEDNVYDEEPEDFEDDDYEDTNSSKKIKKDSKIKDKKTNAIYKITGSGKNKTVEYTKPLKKNATNISIPAKVKLQGKTYKITSVGKGAFRGNKKLTLITVGKNIKNIGNKAFYNCKNLRYLQFKTKKLTSGNIGKKAFGSSYASPRVKTDKNKWKQYSQILFSKGMSRKAVFIVDPVKLVV